MAAFDPLHQVLNFTLRDGHTQANVTTTQVDMLHEESLSICINYGSQIGASVMMLAVVLAMNPLFKLVKRYTAVQVAALVANIIRMILLSLYFPSEWNKFYSFWAGDYEGLAMYNVHISVGSTIFSLFVMMLIETALMMQAWTMVSLWSKAWKWAVSVFSLAVCLLTVGFRFAYCVLQGKLIYRAGEQSSIVWVGRASIILGAASIFWFCALFNVPLFLHLYGNRTILPSATHISPMEALIMANGILMIIPVIFASLEWTALKNFEAASLTYTSVVLVLPLGTMVAHRLTRHGAATAYYNNFRQTNSAPQSDYYGGGSGGRYNGGESSFGANRSTCVNSQVTSRGGHRRYAKGRVSPIDLELATIDRESDDGGGGHHVRVDREIDQTVEHLIDDSGVRATSEKAVV